MPEQLIEELRRLQDHEEYAQKLVNLIAEDEDIELRWANTDIAALHRIECAINKRIHDVSEQIEQAQNEPMDRFRRREVK